MNTQSIRNPAFIDDQTLNYIEKIALAGLGSILLVLCAKLMVPFWPVAMTLQPLVVIGLGVVLGPRLALAATLAYLAEGAAGLPVFADSLSYPGLAMLTKPSAGFLLGFPIAAYVVGFLAEKGWTQSWLKSLGLFAIGNAVIYSFGMTWLAGFVGAGVAIQNMLLWLPAEAAKICLGVTATRLYVKASK